MTPIERSSLPLSDTGVRHSSSESPSAKAAKPAAPSSMRSASDSARPLGCVIFQLTLELFKVFARLYLFCNRIHSGTPFTILFGFVLLAIQLYYAPTLPAYS